MSSDFQPGSKSAKRSINGCSCVLVSFLRESGSPKYLMGNSSILLVRWPCMASIFVGEHWIGAMLLFCILVLSPEACPKRFKIITMSSKSGAVDRRKSMTSSAQREIRCWMEREERGCRRPSFDAFATMRLRTSMPRMNNMGERGSPYRSPR
jgi:hypothetical protein